VGRIHPEAERVHFSTRPHDRKVVRPFLLGFDVTKAIRWSKGPDSIIAFYLKAERTMADLLGLERELLMVYSPFEEFQARSIELLDALASTERVRLDPLGSVLISDAPNVRDAVREYLATDSDRAPIVALSTRDLAAVTDLSQLKAVFIEQYFRRDLFALESPLRHDTLFFGRQEVLSRLIDRFRTGQNTGLFGLRRMGKTSVLYALGRRCREDDLGGFTYIDLSNPGLYGRRWRDLLRAIVRSVVESLPADKRPYNIRAMRYSYSDDNAAYHFKNDMALVRSVLPKQRLLIALDEIENISFGISPADHWTTDFLPFWQTMRSVHQESRGDFCYILVGVNPHPMEADRVGKFDNPLFSTVQQHYLPPFTIGAVRDMVRRLSRSMGIQCEEDLYRRLSEEYGGHPFLIRQACSHLVAKLTQRPARITAEYFDKERSSIAVQLEKNVRQILNVLALWYPEEYELLRRLAHGKVEEFIAAAKASSTLTEHLEGYGLLKNARAEPTLSIDLVRSYLSQQTGPTDELPKVADTLEDMLAESSRRRNAIEPRLRSIAALALVLKYGDKAAAKAMACWPEDRRNKLMQYAYADLWQQLLFSELIAVFDKEYDAYQNWFGVEKDQVLTWLRHINEFRPDAHAKKIDETDWAYLRVCFKKVEDRLEKIASLYPIQPASN
jgi:AAA-like domain